MQISIVIISYNVKEFLQQSVLSLQKSCHNIEHEIIVVDNNSIDGSDKILKSKFPEVKLIKNHDNKGFAKACNQGLEISTGKYMLLLNPDTMLQEDTIPRMLAFFEKTPDAGAAGCKILNADGSLQLSCRRSFPTPSVAIPKIIGLSRLFPKSKLFSKYNLTYEDPDEQIEVDALSGAFMMFRREVYDQIGGLDEDYFMYGEDLDYCYRIKQAGWKIYYTPSTKLIHYKGESAKLATFDNFVVFYKAMDIFVQKHFSRGYYILLDVFLRIGIFARGILTFFAKFLHKHTIMQVDGIVLALGILIAHNLQPRPLPSYQTLLSMMVFYLLLWLGTGYSIGLYDRRELSYSHAAVASILSFIISMTINYYFNDMIYAPRLIVFSFIAALILLPGWRVALLLLQRRQIISSSSFICKALLSRRTILIGTGPEGNRIAKKLQAHIEHGFEILGFVDKKYQQNEWIAGFPFLGVIDDLAEIIRIHKATEIIFTTDRFSNDEILSVLDKISNTRTNIKIVPKNLDFILGKSSVEKIEDIPLVEVDYKIYYIANRMFKRLMDIVLSLLSTIFLLPFISLYAFLTGCKLKKKKYRGPNNTTITGLNFYKENNGIIKNLTRAPLILSVLKGDMSMVGSELISAEKEGRSLYCKPGITGLFQVQGNHKPDEIDKKNYEHYYMLNYSLFLDVEIIIKAILRI
jgi:GT2 family glycosyltransferase/lipopolysaccharide/colanic/teichoic acid biosynthesis glycosyltransferase